MWEEEGDGEKGGRRGRRGGFKEGRRERGGREGGTTEALCLRKVNICPIVNYHAVNKALLLSSYP